VFAKLGLRGGVERRVAEREKRRAKSERLVTYADERRSRDDYFFFSPYTGIEHHEARDTHTPSARQSGPRRECTRISRSPRPPRGTALCFPPARAASAAVCFATTIGPRTDVTFFPRAARGDAPFGDDDDARVDSEEPYAATIESLLETEAAFPPHQRAWRWLECLSACGWVQGGADSSRVEVRESTKAGAGVFARTDIRRRTALGTYPGVRRSLADYCAKADRTNGRSLAYGLMCRDGWVLDPTDAAGGVAVRGFAEPGERRRRRERRVRRRLFAFWKKRNAERTKREGNAHRPADGVPVRNPRPA
jgi:hypothetical protein